MGQPSTSKASESAGREFCAKSGEIAVRPAKSRGAEVVRFSDAGLLALLDVRRKLANANGAFNSASRIVSAPYTPPDNALRAGLEGFGIDYSIADLSDPEAAAKIDAWVTEVTQGTIPDILGGPVSISSIVALNARRIRATSRCRASRRRDART
jgi:hypothetical protein